MFVVLHNMGVSSSPWSVGWKRSTSTPTQAPTHHHVPPPNPPKSPPPHPESMVWGAGWGVGGLGGWVGWGESIFVCIYIFVYIHIYEYGVVLLHVVRWVKHDQHRPPKQALTHPTHVPVPPPNPPPHPISSPWCGGVVMRGMGVVWGGVWVGWVYKEIIHIYLKTNS